MPRIISALQDIFILQQALVLLTKGWSRGLKGQKHNGQKQGLKTIPETSIIFYPTSMYICTSFNKGAKPFECKAHIKIQDWSQSDELKEIILASVNVNFPSLSCRSIFILSSHPISMVS